MEFPATGSTRLGVVAIYAENGLIGDYAISLDTFDVNVANVLDVFVLIKADEGADVAAVQSDLEKLFPYPNIEVDDQAGFRDRYATLISQVLNLISALLLFAVIIALFGVMNTLYLSIYERTRELGLLRAVGLTRRQTRSMVRWEAVIVSVMGALFGVVIGIAFGWALQQALEPEGFSELGIPGGQLTVYVLLAAILGVIFAIFPPPRGEAERAGGHLVRVAGFGRKPGSGDGYRDRPMPTIELTDGTTTELPEGEPLGPVLPPEAIAARVDGELVDLSFVPPTDGKAEPVLPDDPDGLHVLRHSAAHVMAQAVCDLWPGTRYAIGPPIEDGFYYDLELPGQVSESDLAKIEDRMREIVAADQPFVREDLSRAEASSASPTSRTSARSSSRSRWEVPAGDTVTVYRNDGWADLCLGPHVPSTGRLTAFKLMKVAGAYWRGDEARPMLTRIYGTAWVTEGDLDDYLHRLEEAEKRDHRRLGRELDLFSSPEELGPGLWVWHPKGGIFRKQLEDYVRDLHLERGYDLVVTPHIARSVLWETSGHLEKYSDNMYPPMRTDTGDYYAKPMNCPFHVLVFKSKTRSYRDLPMRLSELGTIYRHERRDAARPPADPGRYPRRFAHLLHARPTCRRDLEGLRPHVRDPWDVRLHRARDQPFDPAGSDDPRARDGRARHPGTHHRPGSERSRVDRSRGRGHLLRPEGGLPFPRRDRPSVAADDGAVRLRAPGALRARVCRRGQPAASAGDDPPSDPRHAGALQRGADRALWARSRSGSRRSRSAWCRSPTVTSSMRGLASLLRALGLRPAVDESGETVGKKVRAAQLAKAPYVLVIGDKEIESGELTVRDREGVETKGVPFDDFAAALVDEAGSSACRSRGSAAEARTPGPRRGPHLVALADGVHPGRQGAGRRLGLHLL